MKPVKAYIGWVRGNAIVSWLIRKLDGGRFNHVLIRFVFADGGSLIYESHIKGGVQITPSEQLMKAWDEGKVEDYCEIDLGLTPEQCCELWDKCRAMHGKGYDCLRIITYYLWIRATKRTGKRIAKCQFNDMYTCNEFVVTAGKDSPSKLKEADYTFTIEPLYQLFWGHPSQGDDK